MTNTQLYLAIGLPVLVNTVLFVLLLAHMNTSFGGLRAEMNERFNAVDRRFDDMRDLWRAELHRVEEVLDARLKHLEGR